MAAVQGSTPVRAVAAATLGYSVAIVVAPKLLAGPLGLVPPGASVPSHVAGFVRSIGVRDGAVAGVLLAASDEPAMTALTAARIIADIGDALVLSRMAQPKMRAKVVAAALGWGVVQAAALMAARRTDGHARSR